MGELHAIGDDNVLVGTAVRGQSDPCFGSDGIPQSFIGSVAYPDGQPRMIVRLPADAAVTLIGGGGSGQGAVYITESGATGLSAVPLPVGAAPIRLFPVAPDPFNSRTVASFEMTRSADVSLQVFDLRGNLVRDLFRGHRTAGVFNETWNGLDNEGRSVSSGTYLFRLEGAGAEQTQKAVLVR